MNKIEIVNHALTLLGEAAVLSPEGAPAINSIYNTVKKKLLRSYPFACAKKTYVLNPLSEEPEFGFMYKYQIPNDCLRINPHFFAENGGTRIGQCVFSDAPEMSFIGICNVTEDKLDPDVAAILSYDLAIETALGQTSKIELRESLKRERSRLYEEAKANSAQESVPEEVKYKCSWSYR